MNKSIVSIVLLILLPLISISQRPNSYPDNFVGAYFGPNLSGFFGDYKASVEGETGRIRVRSQYGLFGKIYINNDFSVFTGAHIVLNGALTKNDNATSATVSISYVAKTNMTTFSVPGMFTFTPRSDYGIMLGPQFDLILSAKEPWNRSDNLKPPDYEEDVLDNFNRTGVSVALGAYYIFLNGVSVHLRYTQGIMSITKEEFGNTYPYSIQFYMGVNIFRK